jgi:hypothetical protein
VTNDSTGFGALVVFIAICLLTGCDSRQPTECEAKAIALAQKRQVQTVEEFAVFYQAYCGTGKDTLEALEALRKKQETSPCTRVSPDGICE